MAIAIGLEAPDLLGTVSVGVRLDAQMAERFKRATRSEWPSRWTARCARPRCRLDLAALPPLPTQQTLSGVAIGDSQTSAGQSRWA